MASNDSHIQLGDDAIHRTKTGEGVGAPLAYKPRISVQETDIESLYDEKIGVRESDFKKRQVRQQLKPRECNPRTAHAVHIKLIRLSGLQRLDIDMASIPSHRSHLR